MDVETVRTAVVQSGDPTATLTHVVGTDISFWAESNKAVAVLTVCTYPAMRLVWMRANTVTMEAEYRAGFLAQREAQPLLTLIDQLKEDVATQPVCKHKKLTDAVAAPGPSWFWRDAKAPLVLPQVLLVDGCGVHHHFRCGLACHLAVRSGIPAVGVAKSLLPVHGITRDTFEAAWEAFIATADKTTAGQVLDLVATDGTVLGRAVRTYAKAKKPMFISVGSGLSLDAACNITATASVSGSVPFPIQEADRLGRDIVRAWPEL